jgi:HK97 family phage major capsid protein
MDIKNVEAEIVGLRKELSDAYLSKSAAQKLQDQVNSLQAELATKNLAHTPHPKLINEQLAQEAAQFMVEISRETWGRKSMPLHKSVRDILTKTPQDLSQWVNSAGGYTVQTTIYPVLEQLFLQSGGVRKWFNMTEMVGRIQVSSATDQACATFQGATASLAPSDTAPIDQTTLPLTASTLSPAPLNALYYLSRQLMYNTATNLVSRIFENLAKANTLAEDVTALWGDGTTTYANNYGLAHVGSNYVTAVTTNAAGKTFVPLSIASPASGEALPTLDDLISLTTQPQEEAALGEDVGFYMNRQVAEYFRSLKASSSGLYFLDPVTNPVNTEIGRPSFMFMGYPVYIWNRMSTGQDSTGQVSLTVDSSGAPHYTPGAIANGTSVPIVAFGSFKRAALVGLNRGFAIESSLDYAFGDDLVAYKGREDFGVAWIQYNSPALATINATGASS